MSGMARLILEEGGRTRRFKLSGGKLTFGSGEQATLSLESEDVAELHGQIEMTDEGAVLRVAKGVMPAQAGGRPIQGAHTMRAGQPVKVGSAQLTVEYDDGEGPPDARVAPVVRGGAAATTASSAGRSARASRERPRSKTSGMPGWATALIALVLIVGLGAGIISSVGGSGFDFDARWSRYQRESKQDPVTGRATLSSLLREELTSEQRDLVEQELINTKPAVAAIDDVKRNADIENWLQARLFSYAENKKVPTERPYARLFMKRANWFMAGYPTHPERDRVQRLIDRIEPVAQLGEPKTFDDVDREVWGEIAPSPKDFTEAIRVIDAFISSTSDEAQREQAKVLRAETLTTEAEFFQTKLEEAAVVYDKVTYPDKYDPARAYQDMVVAVTSLYTPEFRADAARRLLAISELDPEYFGNYKNAQPERWASMMTEPSLKAYAAEHGLD